MPLFGVRNDFFDEVGITDNSEIKSPIPVDSRLPAVFSLVVLFSA